jgi:uncharacterized protein
LKTRLAAGWESFEEEFREEESMILKAQKAFAWQGSTTEKMRSVMEMFGVDLERLREGSGAHRVELELERGQVCYVTGPSGAGKSVLLRDMYERIKGKKVWVGDIPLPRDRSVVDCMEGGVVESLRALSRAGLSDVFCVLNAAANLSEGQKWRFRLAKAMASGAEVVFADEFCSTLDRITAAVIAWNVRKWSRKTGVTFVLASCHEDILADLRPDVIVVKHLSGEADVIRRKI